MFTSRFFLPFYLVTVYFEIPPVHAKAQYRYDAVTAIRALQKWYIQDTGLYATTGWWNSANCITTLAEMTAIDNQLSTITGQIWQNTFDKAQKFNLKQAKSPHNCPTTVCTRKRRSLSGMEVQEFVHDVVELSSQTPEKRDTYFIGTTQIEDADPKGFLNGFFDDEGWWALAWIRVYDLTRQPQYLKASADLFEDLVSQGSNATCGGIWWDRKKTANTAISNELFFSTAAHLATRSPDRKDYYTSWAVKQWEWFDRSGLINSRNLINDGLDLKTCKNNNAEVWSYNQGVIIGALVELNRVHPNETYIRKASDIATAAIQTMTDKDGVFHDPREPNLGGDGYQFKGVFVRNLKELYKITGNLLYKSFLERNADSVWQRARNGTDNVIAGTWSGPFDSAHANAASHSSGLDALVAAAAVERQ